MLNGINAEGIFLPSLYFLVIIKLLYCMFYHKLFPLSIIYIFYFYYL